MSKTEYTLSMYARINLQRIVTENSLYGQSRSTIWKRLPSWESNGVVIEQVNGSTASPEQGTGIGFLLSLMTEWYDVTEWKLNPRATLTYQDRETKLYTDPITNELLLNPIMETVKYIRLPVMDLDYLQEIEDDPTPWDELDPYEQRDRLKLLQDRRRQFHIVLTPFAREYYSIFSKVKHILPNTTQRDNQTALISSALEAIGRGYFLFPGEIDKDDPLSKPEGLKIFQQTKNPRLMHDTTGPRQKRRYGNFAGTPWQLHRDKTTWNFRLYDPKLYTQGDVDFVCTKGMKDFALEAVKHNPELHMPKGFNN